MDVTKQWNEKQRKTENAIFSGIVKQVLAEWQSQPAISFAARNIQYSQLENQKQRKHTHAECRGDSFSAACANFVNRIGINLHVLAHTQRPRQTHARCPIMNVHACFGKIMVELNATDAHTARVCKSILIILHQDKYLRANDTSAKSISTKPKSNRTRYLFKFKVVEHIWAQLGETALLESAKPDCARGAAHFNLIALKYLICKVERLNLMPPVRSPEQKSVAAFVCCWARAADPTIETLCPCQVDRSDDKIK